MKVIVEIELTGHTLEDLKRYQTDFFPTGDGSMISIDKAYLPDDPTDDSFVLLRYVGSSEGT